ncbi:WD40 repeat-like protein [Atractiella rhizophila]|nr:WD40 repeat-like protein [Atractiella rhizophila]
MLSSTIGKEEWIREEGEVRAELEGVKVRRSLLNSEIATISQKISSLTVIRDELSHGLLELREEELELEEELESVKERLASVASTSGTVNATGKHRAVSGQHSLRRRKGPAFLPSEHDELPSGVAFMTLSGHGAPITAMDFSEPYGTLVSSSLDETVRVWDLTSGEEWGRLRGHRGAVKCIQVEGTTCVTGGADGGIRIWDLERVHEEGEDEESTSTDLDADGFTNVHPDEATSSTTTSREDEACIETLEGHSKPVTSLYFDGSCLVTGSSDKTLRQWDMTTGQCVLTMDILWALSSSHTSRASLSSSTILPLPGEEEEVDFVGGVQFWGYALASGSAEGTVRMWDMRTGQSHRSLVGHTGPVTGLQFDESCLVSGSLDRSVRIWDLRTGGILETIKYEGPVTDVQFDSRKIAVAASENGVKLYNRTTLQHSSLVMNGHLNEATKLRFLDRYLVSGSKDCTVKVWSV